MKNIKSGKTHRKREVERKYQHLSEYECIVFFLTTNIQYVFIFALVHLKRIFLFNIFLVSQIK